MKILELMANPSYKIKQTAEMISMPDQMETVCTILYRLVGNGILRDISEHLAYKLSIDANLVENVLGDYIEGKTA
jgi:hypothetical protein